MKEILYTAPKEALPELKTPAYSLLLTLSDGKKYARDQLCQRLGGGFRAYLQQLTSEQYKYWLIHTEQREYRKRNQTFYWLDDRHFSGDWELDKFARVIARKQYKDRSYYNSTKAVIRLERATLDKREADEEYQQLILSKKA